MDIATKCLISSYFFAPNICATIIANPLLSPFSQPVTKTSVIRYFQCDKCIYSNKLSCHNRIYNIIKLLEYVSKKHRYHKLNDQSDRISHSHVICFLFVQNISFPDTRQQKKFFNLSSLSLMYFYSVFCNYYFTIPIS